MEDTEKESRDRQIIGSIHQPRFKPSQRQKKLILIFFGTIVALVAIVFTIWLFMRPKTVSTKVVSQKVSKNLAQVNNGQVGQSIDQLNSLKNQKLSPNDRQQVLEALGAVYAKNGVDDKALENLLAAEKASSQHLGFASYATIASIYSTQKKNSEAIAYYQKAIDQIKAIGLPRSDDQIKVYQDNIEALKAKGS